MERAYIGSSFIRLGEAGLDKLKSILKNLDYKYQWIAYMIPTILDKSALNGNCTNLLRSADYLQANDLHELHQGRSTEYLFP